MLKTALKKKAILGALALSASFLVGKAHATEVGYTDFRANGISASNKVGSTFSGEVSWHPSYVVDADWTVRGLLGLSQFKAAKDSTGKAGDNFLVTEFGVFGGYKINPQWEAELGLGSQSWAEAASTKSGSMVSANALYSLDQPLFGYFDKVFGGFSSVSFTETTTVLKVGMTMNFGGIEKGASNETK